MATIKGGSKAPALDLLDQDEEPCSSKDPEVLRGRACMGSDRLASLVDAQGVVREAWRNAKVTGHVDAVLPAAKERCG